MEGHLPEKTYNYVAFKIAEEVFELYADKVNVKEDRVRFEGKRRSLYLYNYDNHFFSEAIAPNLITTSPFPN